jgi:hypothetical protein
MEWLIESCGYSHVNVNVLTELVNWMGEDDFNEFYEFHCRAWGIKSPEELSEEV